MNGWSSRRIFRTARKMLCLVAEVFSPSFPPISPIDSPSKWRSVNVARSISVSSAIAPAEPLPDLDAEQRALGRGPLVAGRDRGAFQRLRLLGDLALRPGAQQVDGAVRGNAVQPRPDVRARLEPVELPIGPEERLLDHVLGIFRPPGDAEGDAEHGPAVPLHELPERVVIAGANAGDDQGVAFLHPWRLDGAARGAVSRPGARGRLERPRRERPELQRPTPEELPTTNAQAGRWPAARL